MKYDYNSISSVGDAEFEKHRPSAEELTHYTVSDCSDVRKMEHLLDAPEGALDKCRPYYLKAPQCSCCGRNVTMYDFVFTALVDAAHPKSFVYQVFTGDKKVIQTSRRIRCSSCGTLASQGGYYFCGAYACDTPVS